MAQGYYYGPGGPSGYRSIDARTDEGLDSAGLRAVSASLWWLRTCTEVLAVVEVVMGAVAVACVAWPLYVEPVYAYELSYRFLFLTSFLLHVIVAFAALGLALAVVGFFMAGKRGLSLSDRGSTRLRFGTCALLCVATAAVALVLRAPVATWAYDAGAAYRTGGPVETDDGTSALYLQLSADLGLADAQYDIGCRYRDGVGIVADDERAFTYFRRAARQGVAAAQQEVARCYQTGAGVEADEEAAADWFERLLRRDDADDAEVRVATATCLYHGYGTTADLSQAYALFAAAAEQGSEAAKEALATLSFA